MTCNINKVHDEILQWGIKDQTKKPWAVIFHRAELDLVIIHSKMRPHDYCRQKIWQEVLQRLQTLSLKEDESSFVSGFSKSSLYSKGNEWLPALIHINTEGSTFAATHNLLFCSAILPQFWLWLCQPPERHLLERHHCWLFLLSVFHVGLKNLLRAICSFTWTWTDHLNHNSLPIKSFPRLSLFSGE